MADIFLSFKTSDTARIAPQHAALRAHGLTVFWSNDIPVGAPNYQDIIIRELKGAGLVLVAWTADSVTSHPVRQECAQGEHDGKLIQVVLDRIEPIRFPMDARFGAQKAMLVERRHASRVEPANGRGRDAVGTRARRAPGARPCRGRRCGRQRPDDEHHRCDGDASPCTEPYDRGSRGRSDPDPRHRPRSRPPAE